MDAERSWRTTGLPAGHVKIGWPRWELVPLVAGTIFGALGVLTFYLVALALPWGPGGEVFPGVPVYVFVAAACFGACVVFTIVREWTWAQRHEPWALASAWLCAMAFCVGFFAFDKVHGDYFYAGEQELSEESRNLIWGVVGLFGAAFLSALVAAVRMGMSTRPRRGWIFVIWGLYMPLWFGGFIVRFELYPLLFADLTPVERTLPEVEGAPVSFPLDPKVISPVLMIEADGSLRHKGVLLDENALGRKLADWVWRMPRRLQPDVGKEHPENPVRLCAAAEAPYELVEKVLLEVQAAGIWKVDIYVRRTERPWLGIVWMYLPRTGDKTGVSADVGPFDSWGDFLAAQLERSPRHEIVFEPR